MSLLICNNSYHLKELIKIQRRRLSSNRESKNYEFFRAVLNEATTISAINQKDKSVYVIRRNLAKDYEIEIEASEAPVINNFLSNPEPYETTMADIKILEEEIFPINDAIVNVFGEDKEIDLVSIKLAIGGRKTDYVSIEERDLIKYDVKPTLGGLVKFIKENKESILGFVNREYISEEGNVIYLNCRRKNLSDNILSIKLKIMASMQQRGLFLQQEHKYYGAQLFLIIEAREQEDEQLLKFFKELDIDWKLIMFKRDLYINDWTIIECEKDSENLKNFLRIKYDNLNYFDIKNIIRMVKNNKLPFNIADKMASLLKNLKKERILRSQTDFEEELQVLRKRQIQLEHEIKIIRRRITELNRSLDFDEKNKASKKINKELNVQKDQKFTMEQELRRVLSRINDLEDKVAYPEQENSVSLKKAEIVAAAKLACAYLGERARLDDLKYDKDISLEEILKYQEELTNI